MNGLEELNKKQQEENAGRQLEAIEDAVKAHLTKEALQRFGAVKLAHPKTAMQLVLAIARAVEQGKLEGMLDEAQLIAVLKQLSQMQSQNRGSIIRK